MADSNPPERCNLNEGQEGINATHINVDERQHQFLPRIVEEYYSTLRAEIYKTDGSTFKDGLKREVAP